MQAQTYSSNIMQLCLWKLSAATSPVKHIDFFFWSMCFSLLSSDISCPSVHTWSHTSILDCVVLIHHHVKEEVKGMTFSFERKTLVFTPFILITWLEKQNHIFRNAEDWMDMSNPEWKKLPGAHLIPPSINLELGLGSEYWVVILAWIWWPRRCRFTRLFSRTSFSCKYPPLTVLFSGEIASVLFGEVASISLFPIGN